MNTRLRELAPAARGSQDAGSPNLVFTFQLNAVLHRRCQMIFYLKAPLTRSMGVGVSDEWISAEAVSIRSTPLLAPRFKLHPQPHQALTLTDLGRTREKAITS